MKDLDLLARNAFMETLNNPEVEDKVKRTSHRWGRLR